MASPVQGRVFLRLDQFSTLAPELQAQTKEYEQYLIEHKDEIFGQHHANVIKYVLSVRGKALLEKTVAWLKEKEEPAITTEAAPVDEKTEGEAVTTEEVGVAGETEEKAVETTEAVPTEVEPVATETEDKPTEATPATTEDKPDTKVEATPAPATNEIEVRHTLAKEIIEALVLDGFITPNKEQEKHFVAGTGVKDTFRDGELYIPLAKEITEITTKTVWDAVDGAIYAGYLKRKAGFLAPLTQGKDEYVVANDKSKTLSVFKTDVGREPILEFAGEGTFVSFDNTHFVHGVKVWNEAQAELLNLNSKEEQEAFVGTLVNTGVQYRETVPVDLEKVKSLYEFKDTDIDGNEISFDIYKGKVVLVVNVSSKCGLTPTNYPELAALDEKYREQGLVILAFPSNQFANQEPGTHEEIKEFVSQYNVKFTFFAKGDVNGSKARPVFTYLKTKLPGSFGNYVKWNFTKFLVDRNGQPYKRFAPTEKPLSFEEDIIELLNKAPEPEVVASEEVVEEAPATTEKVDETKPDAVENNSEEVVVTKVADEPTSANTETPQHVAP